MRTLRMGIGLFLMWATSGKAQTTTIQTVSNYNGWGWEAVVMQNGLITMATMPAIGARVMQYDLGSHPSIFINPSELGKIYKPVQNAPWHNFGGFKNWPAPQDRWNWPPPPILDFGTYSAQIAIQTADSVAVFVSSLKEQWLTPNLRFERKATLFTGSSRVRMEQTLINEGSTDASWSVWDITQCIVNHSGKKDYENFWVYFPISENSIFGPNHVKWDKSSKAWTGEVAPGVYGVQFLPEGKKISADSPEGWIAYADKQDGYIYAKTANLYAGSYPHGGACNEVYIASDPLYLEVEVLGPMTQLPANGGKTTFTINWWAAKMRAPVLHVNDAAAVAEKLSYDKITRRFSAIYGVFHQGTARLVFLDKQGKTLTEGTVHKVTPLEEFQLQETIPIPYEAKTVEVQLRNPKEKLVGVIESVDLTDLTAVPDQRSGYPAGFRLNPNYPNPFNGYTVLTFSVSNPSEGSLKVYDTSGKEIATLASGKWSAGEHRCIWNPGFAASGMYMAKLEVCGMHQILKMIHLK